MSSRLSITQQPQGWLVTRWNKTLFQETLPDLVKYDMLAYPGNRQRSQRKTKIKKEHDKDEKNELELEEGVVFLPFCAHVCKELVGGIDKLKKYFAITFVKKNELPGHALWKGTMSIDGNVMQHRLGKRLDQEEVYCTFQPKDIYESMEDAHVDKDEVMKMLLSIEDFENIRMIRLRPLRQHEPPSVFRKRIVEPEIGGFIGLNWETGRQLFKTYRSRGKNKSLPPPTPQLKSALLSSAQEKKTLDKAVKKKKPDVVVENTESELETVPSDFGDTDTEIDTESDSSSDEDSVESNIEDDTAHFNPYNREKIPQATHYFPQPALDLESYMKAKEVVDDDRVMTSWARTWGPKSTRKKNKKQDIAKQRFQRFQKTQRNFLSSNKRVREPGTDIEEGQRWALGDDENDGWILSLNGDDPDMHLMPKIVQLSKRDNEMAASQQLFEMKNPGLKKYSRAWLNEPFISKSNNNLPI